MNRTAAGRGGKPRKMVETPEYAAFCRRVIRSYSRRVGEADEVDLADMVAVRNEMDEAIGAAVKSLRARGESWAYIGRGLGVSKQAAQQRWGQFTREPHKPEQHDNDCPRVSPDPAGTPCTCNNREETP